MGNDSSPFILSAVLVRLAVSLAGRLLLLLGLSAVEASERFGFWAVGRARLALGAGLLLLLLMVGQLVTVVRSPETGLAARRAAWLVS